MTIYSDSDDERKLKKDNDFYKFLEEDDLEVIKFNIMNKNYQYLEKLNKYVEKKKEIQTRIKEQLKL